MKKIVILSNHHAYTYNFRKEIIQKLIDLGNKVYVVLPYGDKVELLKDMGCEFINLPLDRRGKNPFKDFTLMKGYYSILNEIKPDAVLSYTIKPNIYGGMICRIKNIPFYPNITGLGSAVEGIGITQKLIKLLYRLAMKNVKCIFFQNEDNKNYFIENIFEPNHFRVIPGSGVNIEKFYPLPYPPEESLEFIFISRIMKEKGIDQYLEAAEYISKRYPHTKFHICGFCEEEYEGILKEYEKNGVIEYHGMVSDVQELLKRTHCTIHPTYYPEGLSNVLLESASSARPIISTNRTGTKETISDNVNGYLIKEKDTEDLISKLETFISLSFEEKVKMGNSGREKIVREFNRQIVVDAYIEEMAVNSIGN